MLQGIGMTFGQHNVYIKSDTCNTVFGMMKKLTRFCLVSLNVTTGDTGNNGHNLKQPQPKRLQSQNVRTTNRNRHKPKRPQTETVTFLFVAVYICDHSCLWPLWTEISAGVVFTSETGIFWGIIIQQGIHLFLQTVVTALTRLSCVMPVCVATVSVMYYCRSDHVSIIKKKHLIEIIVA